MGTINLKPITKKIMAFRIVGTSPLITHAWAEKAKEMMRSKHAGKKTKTREVRDPQAEMVAACYTTEDGLLGAPGLAVKAALIASAHKDIGIEKTLVRKALFLRCSDPNKILPFVDQSPPELREDMVRVGMGAADLRYRPMWTDWAIDLEWEVDGELLQLDDVLTLVDRAGFGVGIGEMRPEKGGEYGRFAVDRDHPILCDE